MNIGFIGLGVMGSPMSGHLSKAGHSLFLHDLDMGLARKHADALAGARLLSTTAKVDSFNKNCCGFNYFKSIMDRVKVCEGV